MPYVSSDDILEARKMDLLTYLRNYEPQELVRFSADTYTTKSHDSLKRFPTENGCGGQEVSGAIQPSITS